MEEREQLRVMELRECMKGYREDGDDFESAQRRGVPAPPMQREYPDALRVIPLTRDFSDVVVQNDLLRALTGRESRRVYTGGLTLAQVSFLLYATQGVKKGAKRLSPSAGARHPLETYLFVNDVTGLDAGLYHYLPLTHKLEYLRAVPDQPNELSAAFCGQTFFGFAPVAFVWTCVPYRSEWRYTTAAHKYALLDAGHVCENLYLACEAAGLGTCAIGAYMQEPADALLGLSGGLSCEDTDEFVVYAASVGRV